MDKPLRIVHLDDIQDESEIIENIMRKSGLNIQWKWVPSKDEYLKSMYEFRPDIVLSDHSMPGFSSVEAFRMLREERLNIPFILVTATVSEEFAVMMMKEGIADYVLKDRLQRLPLAVENAIEKWDAERNNKEFIAQIMRSQANLNAIMENSTVSIYSLDRAFRYITFNSYMKDSLRYAFGLNIKVGDVVFGFLNKLDPTQAKEWQEVYMLALQGVSQQFVKEFNVGGVKNYQSFHVSPIREGEMITGLACLATDITKEKTVEIQLAQSEAKFRALIENNHDAIVLRDENRNLLYSSASVSRMLGYTPEEMAALPDSEQFHPQDAALITWIHENIRFNPDIPFPTSARMRHKKGHYIWVEGVITNMINNPSVRGIVANYREVTERKEYEFHQARMTRDLVQRNQDLEQFAYIVSHNLRAPIANILGIANILKYQDISEEDKQQSLKGIFSASYSLDEVIRDLNVILQTKQSADKKKEKVDLQVLVDEVKESLGELISRNDASIVTDFAMVPEITTSRSFMHSIFYNLISNSIKYKQPDARPIIRIISQLNDGGTQLVFHDNGVGIDLATESAKVFGLYKRFHPTLAEGKGMGLFMVKTQVESLGGEIKINSEVNVGTEFVISL